MDTRVIAVSDVIVPTGRFRDADTESVKLIAESMKRFGQLQPIIVDRDMTLVDGLHRLEAHKLSGKVEIVSLFTDEVDELFLRELELEVNIRRKEMTWQEEQRAIAALHELRMKRDPNWTQDQTSELAGTPDRTAVARAIKLTKMMDLFPELAKAKSPHQATSWAKAKAASVLRTIEVRDNKIDYEGIDDKIIHGDSVDVIKQVPDGSFRAIITDPPFGIDYDNRKDGTKGSLTDYQDDKESYERLLSMAPDLYRTLKNDGWLTWFLGISWYERCKEVFRDVGFIVDEIPVIWDRSDGRSFTTRPDRYYGRVYDVALHCIKGDPQMIQRSKPNIIRVAPVGQSERETLVERPVGLYQELIRRLTVPGEKIADFFVGSGSCLAAAASLGRDYFGVEKDAERRAYAIKKVLAHTPQEIAK